MVEIEQIMFQFHKGTIRTFNLVILIGIFQCFNSIKVRLEQSNKFDLSHSLLFQFHKGTIRTYDKTYEQNHEDQVSIP